MPKRDERHMASMRKQILTAAQIVFEKKGVHAATMSDVSTQAGLSVGSLYVHFRSKEEVLLQLIDSGVNGEPFDACTTAGELLGLVEAILQALEAPGSASQAACTALEVAAIARRNAEVQAVVVRNFTRLRDAVLGAAARVASGGGTQDVQAVGEALMSLLLSAQAQMLIGVPSCNDAKLKAARMLITQLHGAPVRVKRYTAPLRPTGSD
ncbi:TetR/AcrR family transcriptional regulator [Rugamonas rivuli]|uniref:TetR family transcriptional regulator n=1 Tax=Rugamonas rivuli TaxID=2743358 RepID=A0A843SJE9_9BURK|nr:TetR/AcrR family transcriptional regulator [Rugamonas rivuli]MQA22303.1 TetR family transcriptional regulator [Rugamonas rivuli]